VEHAVAAPAKVAPQKQVFTPPGPRHAATGGVGVGGGGGGVGAAGGDGGAGGVGLGVGVGVGGAHMFVKHLLPAAADAQCESVPSEQAIAVGLPHLLAASFQLVPHQHVFAPPGPAHCGAPENDTSSGSSGSSNMVESCA
jgi:hypothetical protein